MAEKVYGNAKNPAVLDPFQEIVNANWGGPVDIDVFLITTTSTVVHSGAYTWSVEGRTLGEGPAVGGAGEKSARIEVEDLRAVVRALNPPVTKGVVLLTFTLACNVEPGATSLSTVIAFRSFTKHGLIADLIREVHASAITATVRINLSNGEAEFVGE